MEFWEKKQHIILELGFSVLDTKTNKIISKNIVILEHLNKKNGKYVPDEKFNFQFGETLFLKEKDAWELFNRTLEEADYYIGHAIKNDLRRLKKELRNKQVFDTMKMTNHYQFGFDQKMNLQKLATSLELNPQHLHNAGNDAFYTLESALKLST